MLFKWFWTRECLCNFLPLFSGLLRKILMVLPLKSTFTSSRIKTLLQFHSREVKKTQLTSHIHLDWSCRDRNSGMAPTYQPVFHHSLTFPSPVLQLGPVLVCIPRTYHGQLCYSRTCKHYHPVNNLKENRTSQYLPKSLTL